MSCEHTQDIPEGLSIITGCGCAVIRVDPHQVVYDYDKLVDHFYKCEGMTNLEDADPRFEAIEWVEYNVVRGVPYATHNPPDIAYEGESLFNDDDE